MARCPIVLQFEGSVPVPISREQGLAILLYALSQSRSPFDLAEVEVEAVLEGSGHVTESVTCTDALGRQQRASKPGDVTEIHKRAH